MSDRFLKPIDIPETSSPGNPPAGYRRVFGKADGGTYLRDSAGTETRADNQASSGQFVVLATEADPAPAYGGVPKIVLRPASAYVDTTYSLEMVLS